jgi:hypothetical protein
MQCSNCCACNTATPSAVHYQSCTQFIVSSPERSATSATQEVHHQPHTCSSRQDATTAAHTPSFTCCLSRQQSSALCFVSLLRATICLQVAHNTTCAGLLDSSMLALNVLFCDNAQHMHLLLCCLIICGTIQSTIVAKPFSADTGVYCSCTC